MTLEAKREAGHHDLEDQGLSLDLESLAEGFLNQAVEGLDTQDQSVRQQQGQVESGQKPDELGEAVRELQKFVDKGRFNPVRDGGVIKAIGKVSSEYGLLGDGLLQVLGGLTRVKKEERSQWLTEQVSPEQAVIWGEGLRKLLDVSQSNQLHDESVGMVSSAIKMILEYWAEKLAQLEEAMPDYLRDLFMISGKSESAAEAGQVDQVDKDGVEEPASSEVSPPAQAASEQPSESKAALPQSHEGVKDETKEATEPKATQPTPPDQEEASDAEVGSYQPQSGEKTDGTQVQPVEHEDVLRQRLTDWLYRVQEEGVNPVVDTNSLISILQELNIPHTNVIKDMLEVLNNLAGAPDYGQWLEEHVSFDQVRSWGRALRDLRIKAVTDTDTALLFKSLRVILDYWSYRLRRSRELARVVNLRDQKVAKDNDNKVLVGLEAILNSGSPMSMRKIVEEGGRVDPDALADQQLEVLDGLSQTGRQAVGGLGRFSGRLRRRWVDKQLKKRPVYEGVKTALGEELNSRIGAVENYLKEEEKLTGLLFDRVGIDPDSVHKFLILKTAESMLEDNWKGKLPDAKRRVLSKRIQALLQDLGKRTLGYIEGALRMNPKAQSLFNQVMELRLDNIGVDPRDELDITPGTIGHLREDYNRRITSLNESMGRPIDPGEVAGTFGSSEAAKYADFADRLPELDDLVTKMAAIEASIHDGNFDVVEALFADDGLESIKKEMRAILGLLNKLEITKTPLSMADFLRLMKTNKDQFETIFNNHFDNSAVGVNKVILNLLRTSLMNLRAGYQGKEELTPQSVKVSREAPPPPPPPPSPSQSAEAGVSSQVESSEKSEDGKTAGGESETQAQETTEVAVDVGLGGEEKKQEQEQEPEDPLDVIVGEVIPQLAKAETEDEQPQWWARLEEAFGNQAESASRMAGNVGLVLSALLNASLKEDLPQSLVQHVDNFRRFIAGKLGLVELVSAVTLTLRQDGRVFWTPNSATTVKELIGGDQQKEEAFRQAVAIAMTQETLNSLEIGLEDNNLRTKLEKGNNRVQARLLLIAYIFKDTVLSMLSQAVGLR